MGKAGCPDRSVGAGESPSPWPRSGGCLGWKRPKSLPPKAWGCGEKRHWRPPCTRGDECTQESCCFDSPLSLSRYALPCRDQSLPKRLRRRKRPTANRSSTRTPGIQFLLGDDSARLCHRRRLASFHPFWADTQLSADVVVRTDGKISVLLLNDVQAAGLTPEQLNEALEKAASKFIAEPDATVMVRGVSRSLNLLRAGAKWLARIRCP